MSAIVQKFEHSLALPFFGIGMKTDLFQSCGHCWVFQICWQHFHSIIFQDLKQLSWNSHHLHYLCSQWCFLSPISHSRMSGSIWVITSSWLSGSLRSFLYSSYVYACHLFLLSSAYIRSILFLSFILPIFAWNVPLVSLISLKRSLVFPILLFSSISLHWASLS